MVIRIGDKEIRRKVKKSQHFTIEAELKVTIKREDDCFIAYCPDLELSSYGDTIEEAQKHFSEVLQIFFEDIIERGTVEQVLEECGWKKMKSKPLPQWVPPAYVAEKAIPLTISV